MDARRKLFVGICRHRCAIRDVLRFFNVATCKVGWAPTWGIRPVTPFATEYALRKELYFASSTVIFKLVSRSMSVARGVHSQSRHEQKLNVMSGAVQSPLRTPNSKSSLNTPGISNDNSGPEPDYESPDEEEEQVFHYTKPFQCQYGGSLPELELAYETWGTLNNDKSNAVLLHTGLSASAHAKSHENAVNSKPGWWEKFIGPGCKIDTNKFFVICVNNLGGCFGTTGPKSINVKTGKPYGGDFPIVSIADMSRSQFLVLDHLGIEKLYAVIGSSLGGMLSVMSAALFPDRVERMISISGCSAASPASIAYRYLQRMAIISDPRWNGGHYYDTGLPFSGMELARRIATVTYRSGPEWEERFGRKKITDKNVSLPRYTESEFAIEDYLRHQGKTFFQKSGYDPNSILYISKAMDLFDMGEGFNTCSDGLSRVTSPSLILGASSDILFPPIQQERLADCIRKGGNKHVKLVIVDAQYGHDTFLLDLDGMGNHMKDFLENGVL